MEKNKITFINNLLSKVIILLAINSIFYFSTFTYNLLNSEIILLIFITSLFEFLVFLLPSIKNIVLRIIHSLLYFLLSSSKVLIGIYIRQYGNYDIFSRKSQAGNLNGIGDYFIEQINTYNVTIILLSLLLAVLIAFNYKNDGERFKNFAKNRAILFLSIMFYITLAFLANDHVNNEYYKNTINSFVSYFSKAETNNNVFDIAKSKAEEKIKREKEFKENCDNLFQNFGHKNKYTGVGNGKNLLVIQVESLQNSFINKSYKDIEITPNMNKLIKKSFYFNQYYELLGFGNSSDAEYISLHSTYSTTNKGAYEDFKNVKSFGLPRICQSKGYSTSAMHGNTGEYYSRNKAHPRVGFVNTYYGEYYNNDEIIGMGLSDRSFFEQSIPIIKEKSKNHTFTFMITLTCHAPFYMHEDGIYFNEEKANSDLNFERYLNAAKYTDEVIGDFLEKLEANGVLQNTVVAIYGDHHAITMSDPENQKIMSEFLGEKYDYDEMFKIPLIIYVPSYEKEVLCENLGSQLDFLPTITNIMGWNDVLTPMFGVDLLDEKLSKDNIVFPQTYMLKGSYINDDYCYEQDRNTANKGRLLDRKSRKSTIVENDEMSKKAIETIDFSNYIYYNDMVYPLINEFKNNHKELFLQSNKSIMHAGGAINGEHYTNVLEAIDENYNSGKRFFEIDFAKTSDDKYVCLHGWGGFINRMFDNMPNNGKEPISYDEFMSLKEKRGYTQMDIDILLNWLKDKPNVRIITDIKDKNIDFLTVLSEKSANLKEQFIPQIYNFDEYDKAKELGFSNIILTTYKIDKSFQEILDFSKEHPFYGVTVHSSIADSEGVKLLTDNGIDVFVFTVNEIDKAKELLNNGIKAIYTDNL